MTVYIHIYLLLFVTIRHGSLLLRDSGQAPNV